MLAPLRLRFALPSLDSFAVAPSRLLNDIRSWRGTGAFHLAAKLNPPEVPPARSGIVDGLDNHLHMLPPEQHAERFQPLSRQLVRIPLDSLEA